MLVAVTVALLSEVTSGATYVPFAEIDPRLADQLTESFGVPVTVALKCCQSPDTRSTLLGDTDTSIRIVLGAGAANLCGISDLPQPVMTMNAVNTAMVAKSRDRSSAAHRRKE